MRKFSRPPAHLGFYLRGQKHGWHQEEEPNTYAWYVEGKRMETICVVSSNKSKQSKRKNKRLKRV